MKRNDDYSPSYARQNVAAQNKRQDRAADKGGRKAAPSNKPSRDARAGRGQQKNDKDRGEKRQSKVSRTDVSVRC